MLRSLGLSCLAAWVCVASVSASDISPSSIAVNRLEASNNSFDNSSSSSDDGSNSQAQDDNTQTEGSPAEHVQWAIRAGRTAVRGTNLGAWLVSEQWMLRGAPMFHGLNASLDGAGEFQVLKSGGDTTQRLLDFENHHATFVTEQDIQAIAQAGLNTVRVPVGYWITGHDPFDDTHHEWQVFPKNTLQYLDKLICEWALTHNVAVLVSIHAAKGSQNGQDHSAPTVSKHAFWSEYAANVDNTIFVAKFLAERYRNDAAFLGLGLLNEPMAQVDEKVLNQYYRDAYTAVRSTGSDCVLTVMPLLYKQTPDNLVGFLEAPDYINVWVEWHPYFIWGYETLSPEQLVDEAIAVAFRKQLTQWTSRPNANKLFFGEWSLASAGQFGDPDAASFRHWAATMSEAMDLATAGWTYWSWRVYGDDLPGAFNAWSMRSVLAKSELQTILLS